MKENTKKTEDKTTGGNIRDNSDVIDLQSIEREIEELKKEIQTYYLESPSGVKGMPDKIFVRDISELEEKITEHIPKKIVEDEIIIKNIIEQDGAAPTTKPIDFSRVREFEMPSEYRNEMFQGEVENIDGDTEHKSITSKDNQKGKEKNVTEDKRKIFLENSNGGGEDINNFDLEETKKQSLEEILGKEGGKEITGKSKEQSLDVMNTEFTDISETLVNLEENNGIADDRNDNMFTNIVYKTAGKISDTENEKQENETVNQVEKGGRSNSKSAQDLLNDLLQSGVAKEEFHAEAENPFGNIVDLKDVENDKSQISNEDENEVNEAGVGIEELAQLASDLLAMSENKDSVTKNETKSDEKVNRVFVSKNNTASNENNKDVAKKEKSKKRSEKDRKNTKENTNEQNAEAVQAEADNEDKTNVQVNVALNNSHSKKETEKKPITNNSEPKMNTEKQNDKNIVSKKHKTEENSISEEIKEVKVKNDSVVSKGEADKKTKPRIKVESQEKDGLDLWKDSEEKVGLDTNINDIDIEALEKLIAEKSLNINTKDNSGAKDINLREGIEDLLQNSDEKDLELRENIIPDLGYKNLDKEKKIDLAEQLLSELGEEDLVRLERKDSKNQRGKKSLSTKSKTQIEGETEEEDGIAVYDTQTLFSKKLEDVVKEAEKETEMETDEKLETESESELLETVIEDQTMPMMAELLEELSKSEIVNESQKMLERSESEIEELNINIDLSNSKSEIENDIDGQSEEEMRDNSFNEATSKLNESFMEAVISELENSEFADELELSKNKKSANTELIEEETEDIVKEKEIIKEVVKEKLITNKAVSVKQEKIEEPKKQNWLQRLKNKNSAVKNNVSIQNEEQSTNIELEENAKNKLEVRQTENTESMLEVEFEKFSQDKARVEITETAANKIEVEVAEKALNKVEAEIIEDEQSEFEIEMAKALSEKVITETATNKIEVEVAEKATNKVEAEIIEDEQSEFEIEMAKAFSEKEEKVIAGTAANKVEVEVVEKAANKVEAEIIEDEQSEFEIEMAKVFSEKEEKVITETATNKVEVEITEKASNKIEVEVAEKAANKVEAEIIEDEQSEFEIEIAKAFSEKEEKVITETAANKVEVEITEKASNKIEVEVVEKALNKVEAEVIENEQSEFEIEIAKAFSEKEEKVITETAANKVEIESAEKASSKAEEETLEDLQGKLEAEMSKAFSNKKTEIKGDISTEVEEEINKKVDFGNDDNILSNIKIELENVSNETKEKKTEKELSGSSEVSEIDIFSSIGINEEIIEKQPEENNAKGKNNKRGKLREKNSKKKDKKIADTQNTEISQDKANETEILQSTEDTSSKKNSNEQIPILKDTSEILDTDNVAVFKSKQNNKKRKKSSKQKKVNVAVVKEVKKETEAEKIETTNTKENKKNKKSADKKTNGLSIFKSKKNKRRSLWEVIKESLAKFFKPKSEPKNVILLEVEEPFDKGETTDENNETNVFGVVNGNIQGNNIIINPKAIIKGDIQATGKVICMEKSVITGDVTGEEIIVYGMVRGSIFGTKQVTVKDDAIVTMDIRCENIQVEANAVVQGDLLK